MCGSVCVRDALLCLVFIIAVHLGNKVIFYQLSPLTFQVTVNSCNATQTIISPSVSKTIDSRNKSLKYRRRWGANPPPLALQASALATRPPWIDKMDHINPKNYVLQKRVVNLHRGCHYVTDVFLVNSQRVRVLEVRVLPMYTSSTRSAWAQTIKQVISIQAKHWEVWSFNFTRGGIASTLWNKTADCLYNFWP